MAETKIDIPLSYLGNVNIAVRLVRERYPAAILYEVDGTTADGKPTLNPRDITNLRIVFHDGSGTVFITSQSLWGEWNAPTRVDHPWLGDRVIPWPINYELTSADAALRLTGVKQPYVTVTLRWPLYPGVEEPSYIFGLDDGRFVFVGVYTHTVHPALTV